MATLSTEAEVKGALGASQSALIHAKPGSKHSLCAHGHPSVPSFAVAAAAVSLRSTF